MSVKDALGVLSKIGLRSKIRDDDYIDQLNHFLTPNLLLIIAAATYLKQYMGDPIHCWTPAEYKDKDHFQRYVDQYCWIHDMYNVPFEDEMPVGQADRDEDLVGYYRWVSILLLLQALCFKLPNLLWVSWKGISGLDPDRIVKMVEEVEIGKEDEDYKTDTDDDKTIHLKQDYNNEETFDKPTLKTETPEKKKKKEEHKMESIARFIDRRLELTQRRNGCGPFSRLRIFSKNSGSFLTIFFCLNKLLYVAVILAQFFILSKFLNINFFNYGPEVVANARQWSEWEDLSVFPRIAWCDFQIRQLQNVQTFTVQCVLSMNIFIEKIYAIQWFWLIFLLVITIVGVIQSFIAKLSFSRRLLFVQNYITVGLNAKMWPPPCPAIPDNYDNIVTPRDKVKHMSKTKRAEIVREVQDKSLIHGFVNEYLKADGVFVLKSIHDNSNNASSMNIMFRLLDHYLVSKGYVTK